MTDLNTELEGTSEAIPAPEKTAKKLNLIELTQSTLWAALGVQRSENRVRDFTHGHWIQFVVMGLGFTAFFVGTLVGIVHLVLAT